jgi:simple sugar transport system ATP-binding protein
VDLDLSPGRILGIIGVRDSGLETLELAITGFLRPAGGSVTVNGRDITAQGQRAFRDVGAAYLGAGVSGSAPFLSVWDNSVLHAHRRGTRGFWGRLGFLDRAYLDGWTAKVLRKARLSRSPKARMSSFSGGMIQRLVLAREYAEDAPLLVLAEPGQGLDQVSRASLLRDLRTRAASGRGILIFSTDAEELTLLANEILVLRNGLFSARIVPDPRRLQEEPDYLREIKSRIGRAMAGEAGHG